jgi:hypothetical protein
VYIHYYIHTFHNVNDIEIKRIGASRLNYTIAVDALELPTQMLPLRRYIRHQKPQKRWFQRLRQLPGPERGSPLLSTKMIPLTHHILSNYLENVLAIYLNKLGS